MVAVKTGDVDSFVARPHPERPIVLLYGQDAGLVHERAEKLIAGSVDDPNDPFALVRMEGDALSSEPSRLAEEANTVPLFGGRRAVWIKAGSRNFAPAIEALIADPPKDCRIVIEAGDLRRTAPLRTMCEKAKSAVALPCYLDNEHNLGRLVDDEMRAAKLAIAPDARAALVSLIGGDRQSSRSEIQKVALYAHGKDRVTLEDIVAVVADAAALGVEDVVDAAFSGRAPEAEAQFSRTMAAGNSAGSILSAALRYVTQLHKARATLDAGEDTYTAMRSFVPPIHFSRQKAVEAALNMWTAPRLERAMEQLAETTFNARRNSALAEALTQRALLSLAMAARRNGR
jgi:DNA polymerase III subunit delta